MPVTSPSTLYLTTRAAWVPDPSDNPDCHTFYRSFHALRTVLLTHGITDEEMRSIHHLLHHAVSWTDGESLEAICADLAAQTDWRAVKMPERPQERSWEWNPEPASPDDEDAVLSRAQSIFKSQYKQTFPENRINSKHAKAKWAEVETKARELAKECLDQEHADWEEQENRRRARREKELREWQEACDVIQARLDVVNQIIKLGSKEGSQS